MEHKKRAEQECESEVGILCRNSQNIPRAKNLTKLSPYSPWKLHFNRSQRPACLCFIRRHLMQEQPSWVVSHQAQMGSKFLGNPDNLNNDWFHLDAPLCQLSLGRQEIQGFMSKDTQQRHWYQFLDTQFLSWSLSLNPWTEMLPNL